jgi:hypothetical protein
MTENDQPDITDAQPITLTVEIDPAEFDEPREMMYERLCEEFGQSTVEDEAKPATPMSPEGPCGSTRSTARTGAGRYPNYHHIDTSGSAQDNGSEVYFGSIVMFRQLSTPDCESQRTDTLRPLAGRLTQGRDSR